MNTKLRFQVKPGALNFSGAPGMVLTFIFEVSAHVRDVGHRTQSVCTNSEVRRPSQTKDLSDFRSLHLSVRWPCKIVHLLTSELVCNIIHGMDNLPANFGASVTFLCRVMGKHASVDVML